MPYDLSDFGTLEKPTPDTSFHFSVGMNRITELSPSLRVRLSTVGGGKHNDPSRVDSGVFKSMLEEGLTPEHALTTFADSKRGADARNRKGGHFEDYLQRTVREALSVMNRKVRRKDRVIEVDFGRAPTAEATRITESGIVEERVHLVPRQKTEWLWKPYIPAGRITILAGDPARGKSTIAIDLVARLSRGQVMPNSVQRAQMIGTCAIATAEDSTAETIRPRLEAASADLRRVKVIRQVNIDGELRYLSFPRDLPRLRDYIVQFGIRLFVIDPINAFLGTSTDTFRDHDVRLALSPLEEIAEQTGCSILLVAHLNKKEESAPLYRVGGSIGFVGAARSVLAVSQHDQRLDEMVMYSIKNNLARRPPAIGYTLIEHSEFDCSRIQWLGESSFDPEKVVRGEGPQKMKEVREFLREELFDGEVESDIVKRDATAAGIAWRTMNLYKHELGVTARKSHNGKWMFVPPAAWPKLGHKK